MCAVAYAEASGEVKFVMVFVKATNTGPVDLA